MNGSLCQSCLRVCPAHPTNEGVCECGGETCDCGDCRRAIEQLRAGERPVSVLRRFAYWTPEAGALTA
jgi:hypothetical protein